MTTRCPPRIAPAVPPARPGLGVAALPAGGAVLFCAGFVLAVTDPGLGYSWQHNMVSDLGASACRVWEEAWVCSPRHAWFNAGQVGAGLLISAAAQRLRRLWGAILTTGMAALGLGLVLLGLVPSDAASGPHMTGAVLALPVASAGLFLSGVHPATDWLAGHRWVRSLLGVVGLALCLTHLVPHGAAVPRGAAELGTIATLVGFLLLEAGRIVVTCRRWP